MPARPILFSGPMVRAILDGRKTQTRRIAHPHEFGASTWDQLPADLGASWARNSRPRHPRYGEPGDLLWVRETWCETSPEHAEVGVNDGRPRGPKGVACYYRATDPDVEGSDGRSPWRSPLFMPRWASRLSLRETALRLHRLQEISEEDARAEGVESDVDALKRLGHLRGADAARAVPSRLRTARDEYRALWDSINHKRAPWGSNPWVWAISFERLP